MKHLVIRGTLGVGKSTVARELSEKLSYRYVSVDEILEGNSLVSKDAEGVPIQSFMEANKIIVDFANQSNKPLVIDGCFYYQEQIDDLILELEGEIKIFTLSCSLDECIERDSQREKSYGVDAASFVYAMTNRVKIGLVIYTSELSFEETVAKIAAELD